MTHITVGIVHAGMGKSTDKFATLQYKSMFHPMTQEILFTKEAYGQVTQHMSMGSLVKGWNDVHQPMEVASYEIVYFPIRGRAQAFRYLFEETGVAYTDSPVTDFKLWRNEMKPKMPFGQLPIVKGDGLVLAQSGAILRYLGRKYDRMPTSDEDCLNVDMINDHIEDLRKEYSDLIYKNYENGKEDFNKALPQKLEYIDKLLNKWGKTYIVDKISFADYNCFDLLDILQILCPGCLDSFPALKKYYQNIAEIPKIKAYRQREAFTKLPVNGNGKQ